MTRTNRKQGLVALLAAAFFIGGCATSLPVVTEETDSREGTVVGRAQAVLTGPTTRYFEPEVRFFEVVHQASNERFRVDVKSENQVFVLNVPPGDYTLTRVQINEGPFLGTATPSPPSFHVDQGAITYVGTWRFGVDSPQTQRMVLISAVSEEEGIKKMLHDQYPNLAKQPLTVSLLKPAESETRLYENPPYPRVWFFRRNHTF